MFIEHPIEWDDAKVARLWNWYARTAPFFDLYFAKRFGDRILRASTLPLRAPITVLDFGCGPGFLWDHLKHLGAGWHYIGVDFSADSVAQVASKGEGDTNFGGVHHLRQFPVPLSDASIDAVFLIEVVEHLEDRYLEPTLREMHRLLKRGGRLVVSTPNRENFAQSMRLCPECGAIFHEWQHVRNWHKESLSDYLGRFDFRPIAVKPVDFSARGLHRALFNALLRAAKGAPKPHLIGVFQR